MILRWDSVPPSASEPLHLRLRASTLWTADGRLALDARRRAPLGWISHAHADHAAHHEAAWATAPTWALLAVRGYRPGMTVALARPFDLGPLQLMALEAGHLAGAAQLVIRSDDGVSIYTGDLGRAGCLLTPPPAVLGCDELVIDATDGHPGRPMPPVAEAAATLLGEVEGAQRRGALPVVLAPVLGRAQEAIAWLVRAGHRVATTPTVARLLRAMPATGALWQACRPFVRGAAPADRVVVWPREAAHRLPAWSRMHRVVLTGMEPDRACRLWGADRAIAWTDHADHPALVAHVAATGARRVWTWSTHADALARSLRASGVDARPLQPAPQLDLFGGV
jgi:putative mRNA 3-end processing factor